MREKVFENLQKLNWMFFIMIVILVILLFFASSLKYLLFNYDVQNGGEGSDVENSLELLLKENTVQQVYEAPRPIIIVEANTDQSSIITFELESDKYSTSFSTPGYTRSFEKLFFIPPEAHSTKFVIKAIAKDKKGNIIEKEIEFETKKVMTPRFNVS